MKSHKYALLFPMASEEELKEMTKDIKERGLLNKIITFENEILDGRCRFEACKRAIVEPKFIEYSGKDPLGDVISWNLKRRHLNTSQKGMVASELKPLYAEEAKKKQATSTGGAKPQLVENLPQAENNAKNTGKKEKKEKTKARDQAAAFMGVSGRTVSDADFIKEKAPELAEKVKAGEMTINEAKRKIKKAETLKTIKEMPSDKYRVIYADPPWSYNDKCDEGSVQSGGAEKHYP